jgi:hypothetical protein
MSHERVMEKSSMSMDRCVLAGPGMPGGKRQEPAGKRERSPMMYGQMPFMLEIIRM